MNFKLPAILPPYSKQYPENHRIARELVTRKDELFEVYGTNVRSLNITPSAFPDNIDVVPYAPAEIENYRELEYEIVNLEQTHQPPQHFLYLRPLPQWQGSLRPSLGIGRRNV